MPHTIGYHIVIAGYGLWLPGDERGSWSEAWDEKVGFLDHHTLNQGDPQRKRIALERMKHAPVCLNNMMIQTVKDTIVRCESQSDWVVTAASIEATHTHLLLTYTNNNIDNTVKWLKDQFVKAIHRYTQHDGPVWCKGKWRSYIFNDRVWDNTKSYIERHNIRRCELAL